MLKEDKIKIKTSKKNEKWFNEKGYRFNTGDIIEINTNDINHGSHIKINVICDICGEEKNIMFQKYIKNVSNGGFYACSSSCAQQKVKNTSKEKFGTEYYMQTEEYKKRHKITCLEKYGVEHHTQNEKVKEKSRNTNMEKYGVEWYTQTEEYKSIYKNKMLEKYGVENSFKSEECKNKIKKTNIEKYGVEYITQLPEYKQRLSNISLEQKKNQILNNNKDINFLEINYKDKYFEIICEKHGSFKISPSLFKNRNRTDKIICPICNPLNSYSQLENDTFKFIEKNYFSDILRNKRIILDNKYELDIYLPDLKLAFEFNGVYWHNELNKSDNYHKEKSDLCEEKGIQLIHIWEDDWNYKQEIVKSIILNKLGKTPNKIFARKCEIKEIVDNKLIKNFLEQNHMQGFIGSSIKIGLFYKNELVSLMTFGKKRKFMNSSSKENEWELLRFCNKLNTNVIGGASKLFKYFLNVYKPEEIITYADRSYSNGNLYKQIGFDFIHKTQPNYYYIIDGIRHHRFGFRKDVLIKEGFNPNKTEHEIMIERKIYRIFNSGNLKYIYKTIKK